MIKNLNKLVNPGILALSPYQPGKPIAEVQRELGIKKVIKLASNENPLGPSPRAVQAMQAATNEMHRYPDGNCYELKMALAKHLAIFPEQLLFGTGSENVLEICAKTFVKPNEEIIVSQYAFATFGIIAHLVQAKLITVPAKNWGHDLSAIANAVSPKTKLIFIANPNNPTGTWFNEQSLTHFLAMIPQEVIVVLDEAYCEYFPKEDYPDYPNSISLLKKYPNLIITRTFSKIYGLAGVRVGYAISDPNIIDLLNRARLPFNVNTVGQVGATAALYDQTHVSNTLSINKLGMKQLKIGIKKLNLPTISEVGNFITIEVNQGAQKVYETLLHKGIIIRPLNGYGMPNHIRVSIGLPEENDLFLQVLAKSI